MRNNSNMATWRVFDLIHRAWHFKCLLESIDARLRLFNLNWYYNSDPSNRCFPAPCFGTKAFVTIFSWWPSDWCTNHFNTRNLSTCIIILIIIFIIISNMIFLWMICFKHINVFFVFYSKPDVQELALRCLSRFNIHTREGLYETMTAYGMQKLIYYSKDGEVGDSNFK